MLGTPSITDVFHQDRWDYVYFDRVKGKFSEPKTLTIFFANEIVREIYSQDVLIAKKDKELDLESLNTTPSRNTDTSEIVETEIIISRREDFLTARVDKNLPVCIDDEFESYQNQKTLVQADDDTLEVRSDEQNQDDVETKDVSEENATDQLFDQDTNEDEDFEIPAFLRRQKF